MQLAVFLTVKYHPIPRPSNQYGKREEKAGYKHVAEAVQEMFHTFGAA
jgi:hypothetical protein